MAIEIKEEFEVDAPIDQVWDLVMDPHEVVKCLPGASLDEVVNETTFDGSIKVKVGAVMAAYKGRVEMTEVDAVAYVVRMSAEGKEKGGGTAKGFMVSRLTSTDSGGTQVVDFQPGSESFTGVLRDEVTGDPIGILRLIARPVATMTVEAQEAHERQEKISRDD